MPPLGDHAHHCDLLHLREGDLDFLGLQFLYVSQKGLDQRVSEDLL